MLPGNRVQVNHDSSVGMKAMLWVGQSRNCDSFPSIGKRRTGFQSVQNGSGAHTRRNG